ncbi:hypothetical protein PybrP1_005445 [[Pythium] brassicae (nom. inval.)]|nr:hypothetical protein PybrP1_005445 [[Pythium] brassicae (nom. inval.)]
MYPRPMAAQSGERGQRPDQDTGHRLAHVALPRHRLPPAQPATGHAVPPALGPALWPHDIVHTRDHYNPNQIAMPSVGSYGPCGCRSVCRANECRNARLSVYCTLRSCPFAGRCGNGLRHDERLALVRSDRTTRTGWWRQPISMRACQVLGAGERRVGDHPHALVWTQTRVQEILAKPSRRSCVVPTARAVVLTPHNAPVRSEAQQASHKHGVEPAIVHDILHVCRGGLLDL